MIMAKKILPLAGFIVLIFFSCSLNPVPDTGNSVKVTVAAFEQQAARIVDKTVVIEAVVLHTCKHGGKRLFLVDGNDSVRVEVIAGKDILTFNENLVGKRLHILGTLKEKKVDQKYLDDWENEVKNPAEKHDTLVHREIKGHFNQDIQDLLDEIRSLRDDLKTSGKNYLSFYYIEANKFDQIKK
jgi:hypothetical protein